MSVLQQWELEHIRLTRHADDSLEINVPLTYSSALANLIRLADAELSADGAFTELNAEGWPLISLERMGTLSVALRRLFNMASIPMPLPPKTEEV